MPHLLDSDNPNVVWWLSELRRRGFLITREGQYTQFGKNGYSDLFLIHSFTELQTVYYTTVMLERIMVEGPDNLP